MLGYVLGVTLVLTALSFGFLAESFADDDSFNVNFDKNQYHPGDLLTISGEILDVRMPIIAVSIYDPSGKILSANSLELSSENTFSKSISLASPFYEKAGKYTVKLDYGQISESHSFVILGDKPEPKVSEKPVKEEKEEPEILLLSAEKKQYTDKDTVKISGQVSSLGSPTVLIGIYDPFGMPAGFYFGPVNSDLEFSTSFLIKSGVNFKVDGTYYIKAHYAETETVSFFDYHKEIVQPVAETASTNVSGEKTNDDDNDVNSSADENNSSNTSHDQKDTSDSSTTSSDEKSTSDDSAAVTEEKNKLESESNSVIQNKVNTIKDEKVIKSEIKQKQEVITEKNNSEKISQKTEPKKYSNLSVEDIKLGKLLNQINLACDSSVLTDTIFYYDGMGPALYRLCNFDDSLDSFNDSLIENPDNVEILVNKGSALGKLGFFSEAVVYYDQAITIDPNFLPAKNNKANALVNLGSAQDAILLYDEILDENPNYVTARKNLEIVLSQTIPNEILVELNSSTSSKAANIEPRTFEEEPIESPEKISTTNNTKEKPANFFEEVGSAFSSLFGFLN